jgi:hypothetical protein
MKPGNRFPDDYYELLGVAEKATASQIRKAYREAAKKWHPDKNPGIDTTLKMQRINEAYLVIGDAVSRSQYDRELEHYREECRIPRASETWSNETTAFRYTGQGNENKAQTEYHIRDPNLSQKINEARQKAYEMAKNAALVSVDIGVGVIKAFVLYFTPWVIFGSIMLRKLPTPFGIAVVILGLLFWLHESRRNRL